MCRGVAKKLRFAKFTCENVLIFVDLYECFKKSLNSLRAVLMQPKPGLLRDSRKRKKGEPS